jgi:hypothetical protein
MVIELLVLIGRPKFLKRHLIRHCSYWHFIVSFSDHSCEWSFCVTPMPHQEKWSPMSGLLDSVQALVLSVEPAPPGPHQWIFNFNIPLTSGGTFAFRYIPASSGRPEAVRCFSQAAIDPRLEALLKAVATTEGVSRYPEVTINVQERAIWVDKNPAYDDERYVSNVAASISASLGLRPEQVIVNILPTASIVSG